METPGRKEILGRLEIIEAMIDEGRGTTQRWGWGFLVWSIGPLIAMVWEVRWPHAALAWPITSIVCVWLSALGIVHRKHRERAVTVATLSLRAVWISAGLAVFILAIGSALTGAQDPRALHVALFALVGLAHSASSLILRWTPQFLAALVWWAATLAAFFVAASDLYALAIAALLFGNVAFGAWLTYHEWRKGE
jgi:hypothetical protein